MFTASAPLREEQAHETVGGEGADLPPKKVTMQIENGLGTQNKRGACIRMHCWVGDGSAKPSPEGTAAGRADPGSAVGKPGGLAPAGRGKQRGQVGARGAGWARPTWEPWKGAWG